MMEALEVMKWPLLACLLLPGLLVYLGLHIVRARLFLWIWRWRRWRRWGRAWRFSCISSR